ncbi:DEAD/DEAH box helicase [Angustibacter sp. Root456]|uniref:DEAD/DEAH box helicase n=1 Tax=Angustibacter sp. Root456 TaxID=1736539 RepID=UPI0006F88901|nr:DEAD/DEAH box helicase [Angustibacter sp. Root456]KQX68842.1 DEAD/DEAH box helicase [Angustibacter sp. Root456]
MSQNASSPAATTSFADLGVRPELVRSLAERGITAPFPIQAATLPDSLAGRDVLGRGRTGSGKTVAFALPTVTALAASGRARRPGRPRALVLLPTRELANQVAETLTPLAKVLGLKVTTVFGGVSQNPQVTALRGGVDVLVACPGRLEDLIGQGHVHLDAVEVTVLDEADHMADLGFLPGVKRLLDKTPKGTQRLLFSATLDNGIDVIVKRYLSNPVTHSVEPQKADTATMEHHVLAVDKAHKPEVVRSLAGGQGRSLLFMRTKHTAKKLAKQLTAAGIPAVDLHGNLSQNARERNLAAFGDGSVKVLVATDIAARGIHVDDVNLVVHVDPPAEHKAYTHRSGRTARAGAKGVVVTLMTPDQHGDVRTLTRQAGIKPQQAVVTPGDALLSELAGPPAPYVEPQAAQPVTQPARAKQPPRQRQSGQPGQSGQARQSGQSGQAGQPRQGGQAGQARPAGSGQGRRRRRPAAR